MRIIKKSASVVMLAGALLTTSCATDIETGINNDPQGNAISFTASVGRSSRATEIDVSNLGDFAVAARGMHHDGVLYDNYLIGSASGGEIAKFSSSNNNVSIWTLGRKVYWPSSLNKVLFIGYTTLKRNESSESGVLDNASYRLDGDQPTISRFSPRKADLKSTPSDGIWADGEGQKDLLVAFKQQRAQESQTTVDLRFRHALTQVSIKAGQNALGANDHRIVKVKGAWIVNAAKSGTLKATIEKSDPNQTSGDIVFTNKTEWTTTSTDRETYGSFYNSIIYLKKDGEDDLLRDHSLMLVPENLTAWNRKAEDNTGAYIMLLCRVELAHEGTRHIPGDGEAKDDTNIDDIAIVEGSGDAKGMHYHQLFPVNAEKYDGSQYGFVCVPISTDWAADDENDKEDCKGAGKRYTFKLDICGAESDAGYYPPIPSASSDASPEEVAEAEKAAQAFVDKLVPPGAMVSALVLNETTKKYKEESVALKVVTKRATGKKVGDPVLDAEIKFSVSVEEWGTWTNGGSSVKL